MIEQASLVIGEGNWAVKSDSLLGYKINDGKYYPREMSVVRATTGTRINEDGLVEVVPYNLVSYSEQFDNTAMWNLSNVSVVANNITAPDGTLTADKITCASGSSISPNIFSNNVLISNGTQYTWSVYAKKGSNKYFKIRFSGAAFSSSTVTPVFDLDAGTVVSGVGTIENVGDGWFRCSAIDTANANDNGVVTFDFPSSTNVWPNGNFNGTEFIYIWGAQLVEGTSALDYLPTTDRLDVARIDYSSGSAALLVEPQRTNLLTYSSSFDNAAWSKYGLPTLTGGVLSPDGTNNAFELTMDVSEGIYQNATNTNGTYACSIWIKGDTNGVIGLVDGNSPIITQTINVSTEWKQVSVNLTKTAAPLQYAIYRLNSSYLSKVYIYAAQCELGTYPTSYIPTQGSTVTRNADVISKTGIADLIGQSEGTLFIDTYIDNISAQTNDPVLIYLKGTSVETYIEIFDNGLVVALHYNGTTQCSIQTTSGFLTNGRHKFAFGYKANDFVFYIDGVLIGTDTSGTVGAQSELGLQYYNSAFSGRQNINTAAIYKTRLTNAQLATLTTI